MRDAEREARQSRGSRYRVASQEVVQLATITRQTSPATTEVMYIVFCQTAADKVPRQSTDMLFRWPD